MHRAVQWHIANRHSAGPGRIRHCLATVFLPSEQPEIWHSNWSDQVTERTLDPHCANLQSATEQPYGASNDLLSFIKTMQLIYVEFNDVSISPRNLPLRP